MGSPAINPTPAQGPQPGPGAGAQPGSMGGMGSFAKLLDGGGGSGSGISRACSRHAPVGEPGAAVGQSRRSGAANPLRQLRRFKVMNGHQGISRGARLNAGRDYGACGQRGSIKNLQETSVVKEDALYGIAWAYYKQGKFPQAIESFERLLLEYPKGRFCVRCALAPGRCKFLSEGL